MQIRHLSVSPAHAKYSGRMLAISGLVMALYIVVMYATQHIAFGQYQIRIATSLYALSALYPYLVFPLAAANLLSNALMGGLGFLDMIGGFMVGLLTATGCLVLKRFHIYLVALPIMLFPTFLVPLWLSHLLQVPYGILVLSIGIGQLIPGILGVLVVKRLEKPLEQGRSKSAS